MFDMLKKSKEDFQGAKPLGGMTAEQVYEAYYGAHEAAAKAFGTQLLPRTASVEDLNNACGMKNSVDAAIRSLSTLSKDLADSKNPSATSAVGYVGALDSVHKQWIKDNYPKKYDDPARASKRYQFGPLSLIGFEEAKLDGLFVDPVYKAMGIKCPSDKAVKSVYDSLVEHEARNTIGKTGVVMHAHEYLVDALQINSTKDAADLGCKLDFTVRTKAGDRTYDELIDKKGSSERMREFASVITTAPNKAFYEKVMDENSKAQISAKSSSGFFKLNDIKNKMDKDIDVKDSVAKSDMAPVY